MDKNKDKAKLNDELLDQVSGGVDIVDAQIPSCPICRMNDAVTIVSYGLAYCDRCRVHFELE